MGWRVGLFFDAVYLTMLVLTLRLLFRCTFMDPGVIVPVKSQGINPIKAYYARYLPSKCSEPSVDEFFSNDKFVSADIGNAETTRLSFCDTCKILRPPRSFHCRVCNVCIEQHDHHCPWVGTCIALRNSQTFI